jgi:ligand-binding sensor domain-containing protein
MTATDNGLDHLRGDTGQVEHFRRDGSDPDSVPDNRIRAVFRDSEGGRIVGGHGGLVRRSVGTSRFVSVPLAMAAGRVAVAWSFFEDNAGRVWVGTVRQGAFVIDLKQHTTRTITSCACAAQIAMESGRTTY